MVGEVVGDGGIFEGAREGFLFMQLFVHLFGELCGFFYALDLWREARGRGRGKEI